MEVCGLAQARPMVCNDSPAFQRRHTFVRCATVSSTYFPCVIDTTSDGRFISGGVASTYGMHPTNRDLTLIARLSGRGEFLRGTDGPRSSYSKSRRILMENRIRTLGICALILIVSLYVVGIVSHGIIRHTVQTAPVW